jgi:hypothetical protein
MCSTSISKELRVKKCLSERPSSKDRSHLIRNRRRKFARKPFSLSGAERNNTVPQLVRPMFTLISVRLSPTSSGHRQPTTSRRPREKPPALPGQRDRWIAMLVGPTSMGPSAYREDSNSRRHLVEGDDGSLIERSDDIVPNGGRKHVLGSDLDHTGAAGSRRGYER